MTLPLFDIGTDIIEIDRIRRAINKHGQRFLNRIFTLQELQYCFKSSNPYPSLAARFAAKEAVAKALGVGIGKWLQWKNIEIIRGKDTPPKAILPSQIIIHLHIQALTLSMSHSKEFATATALVIRNKSLF